MQWVKRQWLVILISLLVAGAAGTTAFFVLFRGREVRYFDNALSLDYPLWRVAITPRGIRSIDDAGGEAEIAKQNAENLPATAWADDIKGALEGGSGLKVTGTSTENGRVIFALSGSRSGQDVAAKSELVTAGENVYVLTFANLAARDKDYAKARDRFFSSIKVLSAPKVAQFVLEGSIVQAASGGKYLIANKEGELLTMSIDANAPIYQGKAALDRGKIQPGWSFGADGKLSGSEFNATALVFYKG